LERAGRASCSGSFSLAEGLNGGDASVLVVAAMICFWSAMIRGLPYNEARDEEARMANKRKVEIFSADCPLCRDAIETVKQPSHWASDPSRR
jgi:hypothetical protein